MHPGFRPPTEPSRTRLPIPVTVAGRDVVRFPIVNGRQYGHCVTPGHFNTLVRKGKRERPAQDGSVFDVIRREAGVYVHPTHGDFLTDVAARSEPQVHQLADVDKALFSHARDGNGRFQPEENRGQMEVQLLLCGPLMGPEGPRTLHLRNGLQFHRD